MVALPLRRFWPDHVALMLFHCNDSPDILNESKQEVGMLQRPNAVGLILCEQVVIEEKTRNVTLFNSVSRLWCKRSRRLRNVSMSMPC